MGRRYCTMPRHYTNIKQYCHNSVNKLIKFQENILNCFQVTERTQIYYRNHYDILDVQRARTPKVGHSSTYMKEKKGSCQFLLKWLTSNVCLPRKCVRARQDRNSFDWAVYIGTRLLWMKYNLRCPRRTKPTILQCMYDQQRLGSVCASTHYIKQASWIALSAQTVHIVWSSKGLILGGGGPIYGIVRMCVPNSPLFQHCQVYDWPPFFSKKYMNGPIFLVSYVKGPIFSDILVYAHVFRSEIFRGCLSSWYYMNWLWYLWYLCNNQQKSGYKKKSKNRSTF